jgi:hypothetical protein
MPVIVNELEIVTEQPRPNDETASQSADLAQRQVARQMNPDVIGTVWRREVERWARSYAG